MQVVTLDNRPFGSADNYAVIPGAPWQIGGKA